MAVLTSEVVAQPPAPAPRGFGRQPVRRRDPHRWAVVGRQGSQSRRLHLVPDQQRHRTLTGGVAARRSQPDERPRQLRRPHGGEHRHRWSGGVGECRLDTYVCLRLATSEFGFLADERGEGSA